MIVFECLAVLLLAALACAAATRRLIPLLQGAAVIDVPNARSLHAAPVPRGAGLAIAAVVLAMHIALLASGVWSGPAPWVMTAVALGFAALGWADDRASRGVAMRFGVQALLSLVFVYGALPAEYAWAERALCGLALVWAVNLFNFMDGADGVAGVQAGAAALGLAALFVMAGDTGAALAAVAIAGAALGFLRWNWHPARIFLGDAGSYFLGFELAALVMLSARGQGVPWSGLVLVAPFVTDASLTLLARALRGVPVWRAHREHVYQRLVLQGWSPARLSVVLATLLVLLCWPAAALARAHGAAVALPVYGLLAIIWLWLHRTLPLSRS
ncbi:MAG: glycosyl transferase [Proteobacteria bacterium]|jgi:UDP-N-acetylmuramyl pentapeptide phosphotransferase/UDP-N-acetylglucosamine-1-phosphate transferase|nr:glycosyl transferase [Pseudomonadota bacterium]MBK8961213.1 glycosyl transferase [Pseudomonadota bacterium]